MVDELDFSKEEEYVFLRKGNFCKNNFERRNIHCELLLNEKDVYTYIQKFIEERPYIQKIAFSDGCTLYQLNLFNWINKEYPYKDINQPLKRGPNGH